MARIFISHSSKDNAAAVALSDWLREAGWDDVFLDVDREKGIQAGERWERSLHEHASRCEAVLFLVSKNWLSSDWCAKEFDLAQRLSKRLFGVLIDDQTIADLPLRFTSTWQFTDLHSGTDHRIFRATIPPDDREEHVTFSSKGLAQLKGGLTKAGLDPRYFEWPPKEDPDRAPYRGLSPMEAADAGIFFGREAKLVEAMDQLRGLATRGAPRLFVILGASGAGKSSFLRAGVLPRLMRDDRHFCALPVIRPAGGALSGKTGLVAAIFTALEAAGLPEKRAKLRALVDDPDAVADCLATLAATQRVRERPGEERNRPPAIVLCVDQAEEIFQAEGAEESRAFLKLLQHLVAKDWSAKAQTDPLRVIVLFTIRTDGYGPLQAALSQTIFSLPPMPQGAYEATIEPAHEALLRQWAVLDGWLKEDQGLLSSLEGVLSATRDWEANARSDDWLAHTAGRLEDAERLLLRPDMVTNDSAETDRRQAEIGRKLGPNERKYLATCIAVRNHALADAHRRARFERIGLVVALVLFMIASGAGLVAYFQRIEAIHSAA